MMKKLKRRLKWLPISCLLVLSICCSSVVNAIDPAIIIETAVAAIELTVATADALTDGYQEQHAENVKAMVGALDNQVGNASVSLLNYAYIVGKCQTRYLCNDNVERSFNVEVSMYYLENISGVQYADGQLAPHVRGNDGREYLANNIYFDIYYSDGYHYRIRYKADDYLALNSTFNYNAFPSNGDLLLRLIRPNNGRFFDVSDGSLFGTELTTWGNSSTYINIYYEPKNTVVFTPLGEYYTNQSAKYNFTDTTTDSEIEPTRNMALGYFPTPKQICFNNMKFDRTTQSGGAGYTGRAPYYVCAFVDTNSSYLNSGYNAMSSDKKQCFNYYYDTTVVGGTTIDNTNKNTALNGILANNFDLNGLFTAIGDLDATIKPLLDISLPDINSLVTNFFNDMPDFDLPWTQRNPDNNYLELPFPELPTTTGDINITVDITRPQIPNINTNPHVSFSYSTITTTALPPSVLDAGGEIISIGKDITDMVGTTNIIIVCGLIGVGVMLIFKDW